MGDRSGAPWLYWLGAFTAGLTAFYMFRALFLTFFGPSRLAPEVEHHVHESSSKMTMPLLVLALFSIVAGDVSWPKAFGGSEAFDRYLEPVFKPSEEFLRASAPHAAPRFRQRRLDDVRIALRGGWASSLPIGSI